MSGELNWLWATCTAANGVVRGSNPPPDSLKAHKLITYEPFFVSI